LTTIRRFFSSDAAGAIVLLAAAIAALIVANSPLASTYFATLHHAVGGMSVHHWIDDGAMALFFLLIGLEVKSEFVSGHLSTWGERIMPGAAALAGMAVPAGLYVLVNMGTPANLRGWAIPAATCSRSWSSRCSTRVISRCCRCLRQAPGWACSSS
jgi:NhaA family Na+:H+ antiporter